MIKPMLITAGCLLGGSLCFAQSVSPQLLSSSGAHAETSSAQLSWSLGETVIATQLVPGSQLTQGFHQTDLTVSSLGPPADVTTLTLYPNPVHDQLYLEAKGSNLPLHYQLFAADGRLLQSGSTNGPSRHAFDLSGYAPGSYFLWVRPGDEARHQSFQIIKSH